MRGRLSAAVLAAAVCAAAPALPQAAGPALTSAPYDLSLFRDGETRRMRARYGRWTAVCDEIIRLRSRYCSLSAPVLDPAGAPIARLDVSTDDAGRPAALVRLPLGTLLDRPITLAAGRGGPARRLRIATCDPSGCALVWSLEPADFDALKRDGLALGFSRAARADMPVALLRPADIESLTGFVPPDGFADAIAATLRPGPLAEAAPGGAAAPSPGVDALGLRR